MLLILFINQFFKLGAYLANGAEYSGDYDIGKEGLINFHRGRLSILEDSGI